MRIGLLLPSLMTSKRFSKNRIFAPLPPAVLLANTLVEKGHDVYFYTSGDVQTKAEVIPGDVRLTDKEISYFQYRDREENEKQFTTLEVMKRDFEYELTLRAYTDAREGKLDIVHSYHDFGAHYFDQFSPVPSVYTLHNPLPKDINTIEYVRFSKFQQHNYISISDSQRKNILPLNFVGTVHHGLDISKYDFNHKPEDYLLYFGRMIEAKGLDTAIQVARELQMKLYIATTLSPANTSQDFYKNKVQPYIDDKNIKLFNYMEQHELISLIKKAKAFLFPLRWEEPFGLTVIESMACGTPVVAYANGSMPELIQDGKTGFLVKNEEGIEGLKQAIGKIQDINRHNCRKHVEENFSKAKMTDKYIEIYKKVIQTQT